MIHMNPYSDKFAAEYYKLVKKKVSCKDRTRIIESCKKYFPDNFFPNAQEDSFKFLILMPYDKIKVAYEYMNTTANRTMKDECFSSPGKLNHLYQKYHDTYEYVRDSRKSKVKLNVRIVRESGLLACPYCNRDYINSRSDDVAGAQLDHFYNRSKYPVFSLCLYNLIPSCGNCNRIKSNKDNDLVSPFDNDIDFNNNIIFSYIPSTATTSLEVLINPTGRFIENVTQFRLKEAYKIHNTDVQELIDKSKAYNKTQKEEIIAIFEENDIHISKQEINRLIFGKNIKPEEFGKKPLSKLTYDILKELDVEV